MMDTLEIIRQIEADPGLRAQLRGVLLGDEFTGLPRQVEQFGAAMRALAEAQVRTEERLGTLAERVEALAQAQARTEERVEALAEAQTRTEERLGTLAERVEALAEAQARTEERLGTLAERVEALAEAQRATEDRIGTLIGGVRELRRLFEEQGLLGEDAGRMVLASVLREKGWTMLSDPESVDFGVGEADGVMRARAPSGEEVVAVVEAKLRVREADVRRWSERLDSPTCRQGLVDAGFEGTLLPYIYGAAVYAGVETLSASLGIGVLLPAGERVAAAPKP